MRNKMEKIKKINKELKKLGDVESLTKYKEENYNFTAKLIDRIYNFSIENESMDIDIARILLEQSIKILEEELRNI